MISGDIAKCSERIEMIEENMEMVGKSVSLYSEPMGSNETSFRLTLPFIPKEALLGFQSAKDSMNWPQCSMRPLA